MAKKNQTQDDGLEKAQEVLNSSEQWIEKHQNVLTYSVLAVCVLVCGFLLLKKYVWDAKGVAAQEETAKAVTYFNAGAFDLALNGNEDDCIGFAQIADEYGLTQEGKLASLYAGICSYKLGNFDEAADFLKEFDADDVNIAPAAKQLLGDTYVELEDYSKAIKAFKAAAKSKNDVIAPMSLKKMALVYLKLEDKEAALKAFETIKNDYPQSLEAQDIDKFIEYVK